MKSEKYTQQSLVLCSSGELEKAQQRINQLTEETAKARAEVSKVNSQLTARTQELMQTKQTATAARYVLHNRSFFTLGGDKSEYVNTSTLTHEED